MFGSVGSVSLNMANMHDGVMRREGMHEMKRKTGVIDRGDGWKLGGKMTGDKVQGGGNEWKREKKIMHDAL